MKGEKTMITVSFENIDNETRRNDPTPGRYNFRIVNTIHREENEAVILELDIADGEFANHYSDLNAKYGFWGLSSYRSYKGGALKYFAKFVHDLEESNSGYKWDGDETKWHGLKIAGDLYFEEYIGNDGKQKTRARIKNFYPVDNNPQSVKFVSVDDDDHPF